MLVDEDVVDEARCRIEEPGVLRAAVHELRNVVARSALQKRERVRTLDGELAHVRDVEQPDALADGGMLFEDPRELHRQLPPAEINHLPAKLMLDAIQGSFLQVRSVVRHSQPPGRDVNLARAMPRVQRGGFALTVPLSAPPRLRVKIRRSARVSFTMG